MSISPDQFLNQPSDPDEDALPEVSFAEQAFAQLRADKRFELTDLSGYIASIDESVRTIAASFGVNAELEDERNTLREEVADLHDKYAALFGLVADVEKLVSKSTSKLALSVRDAITGWKTGTVVDTEPMAPEIVAASALNVSTYIEGGPDPIEEIVSPAHDAPVEEWREFASGFELAEGIDLEQMNRSQIRSVLGISQTAAADSGEPSDG